MYAIRSYYAVNTGFRDEVAPLIGERHRQFAGREFRLIQGHFQHLQTHLIRDAVPDPAGATTPVFESSLTEPAIQIVPSVKGRTRHADLLQGMLWKRATPAAGCYGFLTAILVSIGMWVYVHTFPDGYRPQGKARNNFV